MFGQAVLTNISGNKWSFAFTGANTNTIRGLSGAGLVSLSGVLDRVRLTMVNGTDAFDAGAINIFWEF
jgi:expansin (peptidoglycan-binding protein)